MCFANNDMNMINNGKYIEYSGVYILDMVSKNKYRITENSLPTKVILGRLEIAGKYEIEKLSIEKVKTIFEDGKFLGPRIIDEIEEEY